MKKMLVFDCETTGLDFVKNDIIQLAGIIVIDGKEVEEFNFKCQPFSYDNVSKEALEVHGMDIEIIKTFETPQETYKKFIKILSKHVEKFDKLDKYYPAGYNVSFDLNFLSEFFKKNNDKYFGSWQNWKAIDPLPYLRMLDYVGVTSLQNYKLETVCEYLKIEIQAHDALSDIRATYKIIQRMLSKVVIESK